MTNKLSRRDTRSVATIRLNFDSADKATEQLDGLKDKLCVTSRADKIERNKYIILVLVTVFITVAFVGYCLYIVLTDVGSADNIKWATSVLSGTAAALLGYFIRRSQRVMKDDD